MAAMFVSALTLYAIFGVIFAIAFLWRGIERVDEAVPGSTLGFRLIILPGVAALWPFLLMRWIHGSTTS